MSKAHFIITRLQVSCSASFWRGKIIYLSIYQQARGLEMPDYHTPVFDNFQRLQSSRFQHIRIHMAQRSPNMHLRPTSNGEFFVAMAVAHYQSSSLLLLSLSSSSLSKMSTCDCGYTIMMSMTVDTMSMHRPLEAKKAIGRIL